MQAKKETFERLLNILDELREKCPWDREQTNESLRTHTIEETYELAEALLKKDDQAISKELGDLLLHVVFYAKIGEEKGAFDIGTVMQQLIDKLIYRHPHIFGEVEVNNSVEVEQNWEQLKLKEKDGNKTVLSGVPASLPALVKANRIQEKVRNVGFDWEEREQVWEKLQEEIAEVRAEIAAKNADALEAEFGDLFFSLVNTARLYGINPENALERTNQKFTRRFNYLEAQTIQKGRSLRAMRLTGRAQIWEEAKKALRGKVHCLGIKGRLLILAQTIWLVYEEQSHFRLQSPGLWNRSGIFYRHLHHSGSHPFPALWFCRRHSGLLGRHIDCTHRPPHYPAHRPGHRRAGYRHPRRRRRRVLHHQSLLRTQNRQHHRHCPLLFPGHQRSLLRHSLYRSL